MTLRTKLLLAQAPLALALAVVGVRRPWSPRRAGRAAAAHPRGQLPQRAGRAADEGGARAPRQRGALRRWSGERERGRGAGRPRHRAALRARAAGRRRATSPSRASGRRPRALRDALERLPAPLRRLPAAAGAPAARARYFARARARVHRGQGSAPTSILALNQDAMVRKSERAAAARAAAEQRVMAWRSLAAALLRAARRRAWLTPRRCGRWPCSRQAVRRLGEGDLQARAQVRRRSDEIARSSPREFNAHGRAPRALPARARSASCSQAQQRGPGRHRQPARSGAVLGAGGSVLERQRARPRRCCGVDAERPARRARDASTRACARCSSGCARTCSAARAPTCPRGFEEAVRVPTRPEGERVFLPPRATPVYGESGARHRAPPSSSRTSPACAASTS